MVKSHTRTGIAIARLKRASYPSWKARIAKVAKSCRSFPIWKLPKLQNWKSSKKGIATPVPRPEFPRLPELPAISDMICPNQFATPQKSFEITLCPCNSNVWVCIVISFPLLIKEAVEVNWFRMEKKSPTTSGEWASDFMWWFLVLIIKTPSTSAV